MQRAMVPKKVKEEKAEVKKAKEKARLSSKPKELKASSRLIPTRES
jgi:hypothetical protein